MREKCNIEKDICQTTNRTVNKGSLTVETACVMPLILFTLLGLIYLNFFVHNRAWLTAAAYESAVSGSMEGVRKNGQVYDTARMRSEELGNTGFFGAENLSTQTNVGKQVQNLQNSTLMDRNRRKWYTVQKTSEVRP